MAEWKEEHNDNLRNEMMKNSKTTTIKEHFIHGYDKQKKARKKEWNGRMKRRTRTRKNNSKSVTTRAILDCSREI